MPEAHSRGDEQPPPAKEDTHTLSTHSSVPWQSTVVRQVLPSGHPSLQQVELSEMKWSMRDWAHSYRPVAV
ncbi:MAG: hypothetical protein B7Z66_15560 [Chromatiales bacterium 21-64-14]|nr:MAG: hypothetical protein B7Z66_15560 [Chromatiales bacterium 21-64-14]